MTFESELNLVTISIIIGIVGILSGIIFQLRSIKQQAHKVAYETMEKTLTDKATTESMLREFEFKINEYDKKIEKLEAIIFRLPKEDNPNAWY